MTPEEQAQIIGFGIACSRNVIDFIISLVAYGEHVFDLKIDVFLFDLSCFCRSCHTGSTNRNTAAEVSKTFG